LLRTLPLVENSASDAIDVIGTINIIFASFERFGNHPLWVLHQASIEKLGESIVTGGSWSYRSS
jgi:hypothetical protein